MDNGSEDSSGIYDAAERLCKTCKVRFEPYDVKGSLNRCNDKLKRCRREGTFYGESIGV
jgi:hypothetical protein